MTFKKGLYSNGKAGGTKKSAGRDKELTGIKLPAGNRSGGMASKKSPIILRWFKGVTN
jgi:hypothetical protein